MAAAANGAANQRYSKVSWAEGSFLDGDQASDSAASDRDSILRAAAEIAEGNGMQRTESEMAAAVATPTEKWRLSIAAFVAQRMACPDTQRITRDTRLDSEALYPFPREYI